MIHVTKKNAVGLFFLLLSFLAVKNMYESELEFVSKFMYILGLIGCVILITNAHLKKNLSRGILLKRFLIFLFASISLNTLTYQSFYNTFFAQDILLSSGLLLFLNYLLLAHLLDLKEQINNYLVLASFMFIPFLTLAKSYYTAETYATFGFLLATVLALRLVYTFGRDIEVRKESI